MDGAMSGTLVLVRTLGAPKYHAELNGQMMKFFKSKSHVDDVDRVVHETDALTSEATSGFDVDEHNSLTEVHKSSMAVRTWNMVNATKAESSTTDSKMFTITYKNGHPSKLKAPTKLERNRWVSAITRAVCIYNKADMHIALDAQKTAMEYHFEQIRLREESKKELEDKVSVEEQSSVMKANFPAELLSSRSAILFAGDVFKLNSRLGKVRVYLQIRGRYLVIFRSPKDARLVRRALVRDPGFSFLTEARIQSVWDMRRIVSVHMEMERKPAGLVVAATLDGGDNTPFVKRIECHDKLQATALHKALLAAKDDERKKEEKTKLWLRRQTSTRDRFNAARRKSMNVTHGNTMPDFSGLSASGDGGAALTSAGSSTAEMLALETQAQAAREATVAADHHIAIAEQAAEDAAVAARARDAAASAAASALSGAAADSAVAAAAPAVPPTAPAAAPVLSSRPPSKWTAIKDPSSGRDYYTSTDGVVRWEPPPDLVPCPFNGGFWVHMKDDQTVSEPPLDLFSLWNEAADGAISDDTMVGLHGVDQYWPLKSILRRAVTVHHLFVSADADGDGSISTEEFTAWIKAEGSGTVDQSAIDMITIFQSMDSDEDGAISRIEFMCFLLQHSDDVETLVEWIDSRW